MSDDELLSVRLLLADAVALLRAVRRDPFKVRGDVDVFLARLDQGTRCARSRLDDAGGRE